MTNHSNKYNFKDLIQFSTGLMTASGLSEERAVVVAETLVEADLMGHFTHGLQLLVPYVSELLKDDMTKTGDPIIIHDKGSSLAWDGNYLPGPWLVKRAIQHGIERVKEHAVFTSTIQKSHHIGCLAAYPEMATKQGLVMLLSCSDPRNKTVAPFGGLEGVYSPNPIAAGFPTETDPIIFDISMSTTANGLIMKLNKENKKLPHKWLLDGQGEQTDDPGEFFKDPPATILPLGSIDTGYKGFALGILVEALTSALGGSGRADQPGRWGASVFLQIIDPEAFGGLNYFKREMQHLMDASLKCKPHNPDNPVRIPGQRALKLRELRKKEGVPLSDSIVDGMEKMSKDLGVEMPAIV